MKMFTKTIIVMAIMTAALPLFGNGNKETEPAPMMDGGSMEKSDAMGDKGLREFTSIDDAMMKAGEKPTVLFFEAGWCPSCQSARKDFMANADRLGEVNLISVDYDHSADLQAKYGVTYQHTFVQIDPDGEALAKWNGGGTEELLMKIVKGGM